MPHIFLTGQPGVGKSTLIDRVLSIVSEQCPDIRQAGFWTGEVRQGANRLGFDVHTLQGASGVLARESSTVGHMGPCVGKYSVDVDSFQKLALPELHAAAQPGTYVQLCVIDEIGKMELLCKPFYPAVKAVLENAGVVVLGTIPVPGARPIREVEEVRSRPDVKVFTVTRDNRNQLVTALQHELQAALAAARGNALQVRP